MPIKPQHDHRTATPVIEIVERLARIEVGQEQQKGQLDKVINLLDRMVRVEERLESVLEANADMQARITGLEAELDRWSTGHKIVKWVVGIMSVVAAGVLVELFSRHH